MLTFTLNFSDPTSFTEGEIANLSIMLDLSSLSEVDLNITFNLDFTDVTAGIV